MCRHKHRDTCVCTSLHGNKGPYTQPYMYTHMFIGRSICTHRCTRRNKYRYTGTQAYVHTQVYTHTGTCTFMQTCMHTYTLLDTIVRFQLHRRMRYPFPFRIHTRATQSSRPCSDLKSVPTYLLSVDVSQGWWPFLFSVFQPLHS